MIPRRSARGKLGRGKLPRGEPPGHSSKFGIRRTISSNSLGVVSSTTPRYRSPTMCSSQRSSASPRQCFSPPPLPSGLAPWPRPVCPASPMMRASHFPWLPLGDHKCVGSNAIVRPDMASEATRLVRASEAIVSVATPGHSFRCQGHDRFPGEVPCPVRQGGCRARLAGWQLASNPGQALLSEGRARLGE